MGVMRASSQRRFLHRAAIFAAALAAACAWAAPARRQATATGSSATKAAQSGGTAAAKPDRKAAKEAYRRGIRAEQDQDWAAAYAAYSDAVQAAPDEREYALRRELAKARLLQAKVDEAEKNAVSGELAKARKELLDAHYLDPSDSLINERLSQLMALEPLRSQDLPKEPQLLGGIHLDFQHGTRSFDYRGDLQGAYREIARQFGVDVAFDAELPSRPIHFQASAVDFLQAMELAGAMTRTFWQPLTKHLFFVAEDTQQKRKEYETLIVRTIALPASETPEEMTDLYRLVREVGEVTLGSLNTAEHTITLRASPRGIAVASDLIESLEQPVGELVLEVEVLEVDRNYARQIGITPPQTAKVYSIESQQLAEANNLAGLINVLEQLFGTPSGLSGLTPDQIATEISSGQLDPNTLLPPVIAFGGGQSTFLSTLPGATANLGAMLSLVRHGRRILLRAEDGQPATFFVGERYPVSLAQYSSSLTSNVNTTAISTQTFPTTTLTTGNTPAFVTVASLRNNGTQDLIVSNHGDNTISVFLGNGDGTFAAPVTYATGVGPTWIASGVFDNTGTNVDLVVANKGANTVSILAGNGDGTFQPNVDLATGNVPVSVVAGDFDGDGNLDLAVANQADNTISVFFGNGDGTFNTPALLTAGHAPTALATADFNGDGRADLAVANQNDNTVSIFLGNNDRTFTTLTPNATGAAPVYVATGDFNGDGILDLAVANNTDDTVSILFGQTTNGKPDGTFTAHADYVAGAGPTSIAVADYNLDGIQDLAVTDSTSNTISLLFGLTGGIFNANYELSVGDDPISVVTADFNGDGHPDGAVANNASNSVSVILNSTSASTSSTGGEGTEFPNAEYLDLGLKMKATPRIHPDDEVTLQLHFEISSLAGQSFNSIPVINNTSVDQTVRLKENQTTMLAGILQPSITSTLAGTPGIAQVPGLGVLGGNRNTQEQDTQLLILITPRMVALAPHKGHAIYAGHGAAPAGYTPTPRFEHGLQPQPVPQPPQPQQQPPQPQQQPPQR
ncbi:MAG TPA: FG-GAP-like repeat-containing protein [Candidatus Acidoferrum sp.]|nr:FG-GAP-like repeat-containing protein [Candidatus Acidoferrum sp.]